ncbi:hypothetical protein CTAYLR_007266 [Chrysophaeum taylorii]|uniref:tRNA (guanine(9)-N(1))-methyltransferase n=1 Tax=Chrysophaeum taylorii TaxID=2483200 RepID=A0AAD7UIH2_9STRA|nr:hypothetical protein CTAYLR_007266 [Chrysophaeum taylorii]
MGSTWSFSDEDDDGRQKKRGAEDGDRGSPKARRLLDNVENRRDERRRQRLASQAAFVAQCAQNMTIAVDCSFESFMTERELTSLGQQLMYCYGANKRASAPATFWIVGLEEGGKLHSHLRNLAGFDRWLGADVDFRSLDAIVPALENVVYLTADADDELAEIDSDAVYVLGGIVDRNRHKGITATKAETLGIRTARLPIGPGRPLQLPGPASHVLTVNHVFDILLNVQASASWATAAGCLPQRKTKRDDEPPRR